MNPIFNKSNQIFRSKHSPWKDGVTVRIFELSFPSIIKSLLFIFGNCLIFGTFPEDWKKGNVVPVHKKR